MYANLTYIARLEAERRREAEQRAADWRLIRRLSPATPSKKTALRPWQLIGLLRRLRERQIIRARLRAYAAR